MRNFNCKSSLVLFFYRSLLRSIRISISPVKMQVFRVLMNRLLNFIYLKTVSLLYVFKKLHKVLSGTLSVLSTFYWILRILTFIKILKSEFWNLFKWILSRLFCFKFFCFDWIAQDWFTKWWGIDHSFVLMVVSHPYECKESFHKHLKSYVCSFEEILLHLLQKSN